MSRSIDVFSQFLDANAEPLANGYLSFFVNETATPLATYNDEAQTILNPVKVPLDGEGRLTLNVYVGELSTGKLFNSVDAQIESFDNITPRGGGSGTGGLAEWVVTDTYNTDDVVKGSDGNFYKSLSDTNIGNDPISSPTSWEEIRFIGVWNTNIVYGIGDIVQTSTGNLWKAVTATSGNDPEADDGVNWLPATSESWKSAKTTSFTGISGESKQIDASANTIDVTLPTLVVGDVFTYHNLITSTFKVQILNPIETVKGRVADFSPGTNIEISAGQSVQMVALSATVLSIVGVLL